MQNRPDANVSGLASAVAPRTSTEQILVEIWSAVLKADGIGIHDDFLDLGGESLAATRCINRIRTAFDVDVPLEVFFEAPADIAVLASHIDRLRRGPHDGMSDGSSGRSSGR
jgi:hypothetical protein